MTHETHPSSSHEPDPVSHSSAPAHHSEHPKQERAQHILEGGIFFSRWFLYPINVGLVIALVVYVLKFCVEVFHLVLDFPHLSSEELMVGVLGLVDTAMVANLLVMIIQGSHQIFIRRFDISDPMSRPQWLDHIDSGILKVKVALSIAGITLVQILKDFVNLEHINWEIAEHRMYIHAMCLGSALVMAFIWRVTHPTPEAHGDHAHSGSALHDPDSAGAA